MTPIYRPDGRWQVRVPSKYSLSGKRESKYFASKAKADKFVKGFKEEREEHGKNVVTADERYWVTVAKQELGDLSKLRDVLDHWKHTGRGVQPVTTHDAVE